MTVQDTTPPALALPADVVVAAVEPSGGPVAYAATAVDVVEGRRPVVCWPTSDTTFPNRDDKHHVLIDGQPRKLYESALAVPRRRAKIAADCVRR